MPPELQIQNAELAEAQVELQRTHDRYYELYHRAPVAYVTLNRAGEIRSVNRRASYLLDVTSERLAGRRLAAFLRAPGGRALNAHLREIFAGSGDHRCEVFTVADILMAHVLSGIKDEGLIAPYPTIASYRDRCRARPAWKRAIETYCARVEAGIVIVGQDLSKATPGRSRSAVAVLAASALPIADRRSRAGGVALGSVRMPGG